MKIVFCISLFLLSACQQASGDYQLKYVQDGDSVILCCDQGETFVVRLKDIDAPEKHQPFASESRDYLSQLLEGHPLKLVGKKTDRYGRRLADIVIDKSSVNEQMVKTGHAWVWRYSESLKLQWQQKQARKNKLGLWALPESQRIEPWQWRKQNARKK
ncbi:thermonuclease family protein [Kangiella sp. TOML190]|uniref:thermonuclease family protein n=1 Tax=Kangiella sp. TOML190 TaxID=2931351 RepID=UPI00203A3D2C|nr:thermonuclease family protein [Kangiella sp. TOML190]